MEMKDYAILQECHDTAVETMRNVAVLLAEEYLKNGSVSDNTLKNYKVCRLGVESTRKDLEHCFNLEIQKINSYA